MKGEYPFKTEFHSVIVYERAFEIALLADNKYSVLKNGPGTVCINTFSVSNMCHCVSLYRKKLHWKAYINININK